MARKLVTGAAGFIGSHLAEALLAGGAEVTGVDSFNDSYDPRLKEENVKPLLSSPRFHLVREDLNGVDLAALLDGVDIVFHQAAQAGVRTSWGAEFEKYLERNVSATQRLLEAVKESRVKRLVFASSSSVYGEAVELPVTESTPKKPASPYGVTKLAAENLGHLYRESYSVPFVALRYFTVYGPRQRPDMAFHRIMSALFGGEAVSVYGDGSQTRDFTFVSDVVAANLLAAGAESPAAVYNIGGGARTSLAECIRMVEEIAGREVPRRPAGREKGDVKDTWSDCAAGTRELGYRPKVSLREGLEKMFVFYRERAKR